ncbi:hypothetical protein CTI12_AA227140 [Artemisia annua]|uniref:Uncharacterized protein n=1 Tax=Artemisia annua TaxID=35608 RepID=A0A2U1NUR4_ARTAN|nr:hypothetical protein CTI12_AA227140 [Artemisia annua]
MEALKKSHGDTLTQISELDAELAKLRKNFSDACKREQDIIASNKALSSSLGVALNQLKPFEKKLQTHLAKLEVACVLKKLLSQKGPRILEAQTDETISLEKEEIHKLTQESQHLTVQVGK